MSEYVGREHIDGILAEAGMKEQALIAAGEKHVADSRSMILLAREIRFLRTENERLRGERDALLKRDGLIFIEDGKTWMDRAEKDEANTQYWMKRAHDRCEEHIIRAEKAESSLTELKKELADARSCEFWQEDKPHPDGGKVCINCWKEVASALTESRAREARAVEALKKLEWSGHAKPGLNREPAFNEKGCPSCRAPMNWDEPVGEGEIAHDHEHHAGCELKKVLSASSATAKK
jgi:hypothetical protein